MSRSQIITWILVLTGIIVLILLIFRKDEFINWLNYQWLEIIYAAIMALIVGLLIDYIYRKYSAKSKMLQTTVTPPSQNQEVMAKLVIENKHEFYIKDYEKIFGREDFIGVTVPDELVFIGKKHFKITRKDYGFFIEDLNTKNGTLLNGQDITKLGKKKLENGDEILVAKTLKINFETSI